MVGDRLLDLRISPGHRFFRNPNLCAPCLGEIVTMRCLELECKKNRNGACEVAGALLLKTEFD